MATYFFDTSALVKRYHDEPGTREVDTVLDDDGNDILVSSLLVVETVSAFRRKFNRDAVSESEMNQAVSVFFREALDRFVIVPIEESMLTFSFELVLEDDLRTLDSLQLSAGLAIDEELGGATFATADRNLAEIAGRRGLRTFVPE